MLMIQASIGDPTNQKMKILEVTDLPCKTVLPPTTVVNYCHPCSLLVLAKSDRKEYERHILAMVGVRIASKKIPCVDVTHPAQGVNPSLHEQGRYHKHRAHRGHGPCRRLLQ